MNLPKATLPVTKALPKGSRHRANLESVHVRRLDDGRSIVEASDGRRLIRYSWTGTEDAPALDVLLGKEDFTAFAKLDRPRKGQNGLVRLVPEDGDKIKAWTQQSERRGTSMPGQHYADVSAVIEWSEKGEGVTVTVDPRLLGEMLLALADSLDVCRPGIDAMKTVNLTVRPDDGEGSPLPVVARAMLPHDGDAMEAIALVMPVREG